MSETAEGDARVYDFYPNPRAASDIRARLAVVLDEHLPPNVAAKVSTALEQTAEADPSTDMLLHHRRVVILPCDDGKGWQVLDQTYSTEGNLVAANTVFLGLDEDGQWVWPEEYQTLLAD